MTAIGMKGGDKLKATLELYRQNAGSGELLRLGFLEGSTYPDGTSVPYVAAIQEFGVTINVQSSQATIYRKVDKAGDFVKGGRFVKKNLSNFATTHDVPAHTVTIPPRPFFRQMIEAKKGGWGASMAKLMKASSCDAARALAGMGEGISSQLRQSINSFSSVPLAKSTIAAKGFAKQLVDHGIMLKSVDYEVKT